MVWRSLTRSVVALAVVGSAVWFASGWMADPPDSTCGSVFRSDLWWDRVGCRRMMSLRAAVSIAIGSLGAGVAVATGLGRHRQAERLAAVVAVGATAALVVNEAVREGGLLA
jgi:hypothetical protein